MTEKKPVYHVLLILFASLLLVACSNGGDSVVPGPEVPKPPSGKELKVGSGKRTPFRGQVVYGDTGIMLPWAMVTIADQAPSYTEDSYVSFAEVPQGENGYKLSITPLGESIGLVHHTGGGLHELSFEKHPDWNAWNFRRMVFNFDKNDEPHLIRWERGTLIDVIIEDSKTNPNVTSKMRRVAWESAKVWEEVLGGVVQFQQASKPRGQYDHLTFRYVSDEEMNRDPFGGEKILGYCLLWHLTEDSSYGPVGRATRAEIVVRHNRADDKGVMIHEVGHCVGLDHSNREEDLMFPYARSHISELSDWEKHVAQLIYSMPYKLDIDENEFVDTSGFQLMHVRTSDDGTSYYDLGNGMGLKVTRTTETDLW